MAKRITEQFTFGGGKVDRSDPARPIVRDVLLCGPVSANQRRYKAESFKTTKYNDRPVHLNHGKGREGRDYQDKIATIENESRRADGMPVGDLAVNPKHPYAETFLWDAEHKPNSVGMSHVAHCETHTAADHWEEVDRVVEVESVDIVTDPATTHGLHESQEKKDDDWIRAKIKKLRDEGYPQKQAVAIAYHMAGRGRKESIMTTLRAVLEKYRPKLTESRHQKALRKLLLRAEDDAGLGAMMDAPVEEPAEDKSPEDGIRDAFLQAIMHIVEQGLDGEIEVKDALAKVKEMILSHGKVNGEGGSEEEEEEEEEDEYPKESKRASGKALTEAMAACDKAGFRYDSTDLAIIAATPAAQRPATIERLKRASESTGQRPTGASRRPGAGAAGTQPNTAAAPVEEKRLIPKW